MATRFIAHYDAKSAKGRVRSARADFTRDTLEEARAAFEFWFAAQYPRDELLGVSWKLWGV